MTDALIARKSPYAVDVVAGKTYAWCACGRSATQPFCDGTHKSTELRPVIHKPTQDATLYFCGCKQTSTPPLCDGTHKSL